MSFCKDCGFEIAKDANFCSSCGASSVSSQCLDESVSLKATVKTLTPGYITDGPLPEMKFALIPSGSFLMGCPEKPQKPGDGYICDDNEFFEEDDDRRPGYPDPKSGFGMDDGVPDDMLAEFEEQRRSKMPQHRVTLASFQMMTTQVTQAMWNSMQADWIKPLRWNPSIHKGDNLPIDNIAWIDCEKFIAELNQRDPGKGYRLPSEAEWEYACRAGTTTDYYSGDFDYIPFGSELEKFADEEANKQAESVLDCVGWYSGNSGFKTHEVGLKQPNNYGLFDMHGNVSELCEDVWHDSYKGAPTDGSAWLSCRCTAARVCRGGSFADIWDECRSEDRQMQSNPCRSAKSSTPIISGGIGFRLVRDA